MTVFPQSTHDGKDFKVWNKLLVHFAGYRQTDGSVIGDPAHVTFTEVCPKNKTTQCSQKKLCAPKDANNFPL